MFAPSLGGDMYNTVSRGQLLGDKLVGCGLDVIQGNSLMLGL